MQQDLNVDLFGLDNIPCSNLECGNVYFDSVILLKRVPAIMSPSGKEMEYAVQLLKCTSCGRVRYPGGPEEATVIK